MTAIHKHKKHTKKKFLDGEALILLQRKLEEGYPYSYVARLLNCNASTVSPTWTKLSSL